MEQSLLPGTGVPLVSVFPYRSRAREIMFDFKFYGGRNVAHSIGYAMGDALAEALDNPGEWLLTCVPMTAAQEEKRGYNQSELLARAAARWVGARHDPALLAKRHETQVQHGLPAARREENVRGAFAAARPERIRGGKIVLCDDICTTGATLRACARALEEAGAAGIFCLTFLRTELEE
jgi:ComF family protein